jgi:hypothetical protein
MEDPVKLVPDIAVKLGALYTLLRRQHIVVVGVAGAGGVKKAYLSFHRSLLPV